MVSGAHHKNLKAMLENIGVEMEYLGIEDYPRRKPFPDCFLAGARKMGVKPEECVVFEDSFAGVKAAKAAGMHCVALTTTSPPEKLKKLGADIVVRNFAHFDWEGYFHA